MEKIKAIVTMNTAQYEQKSSSSNQILDSGGRSEKINSTHTKSKSKSRKSKFTSQGGSDERYSKMHSNESGTRSRMRSIAKKTSMHIIGEKGKFKSGMSSMG